MRSSPPPPSPSDFKKPSDLASYNSCSHQQTAFYISGPELIRNPISYYLNHSSVVWMAWNRLVLVGTKADMFRALTRQWYIFSHLPSTSTSVIWLKLIFTRICSVFIIDFTQKVIRYIWYSLRHPLQTMNKNLFIYTIKPWKSPKDSFGQSAIVSENRNRTVREKIRNDAYSNLSPRRDPDILSKNKYMEVCTVRRSKEAELQDKKRSVRGLRKRTEI